MSDVIRGLTGRSGTIAGDPTLDTIEDIARRVLADLDDRQPGRCAGALAGLTIAEAYAVQQVVTTLRERRGETVIGYKIGCTSSTVQEQLGIGRPIFGRLFDSGSFRSGVGVPASGFANLAVEGELAIRLEEDVADEALSDREMAAVVGSVFPVIELHDYVLRCDPRCAAELIARNGMHAGFVAGEPPHADRDSSRRIGRMLVKIDGIEAASTTDPWAMGGPEAAVRWLAGRLGEQGVVLRRGDVVLTGSVMPLIPVGARSHVAVEGPGLGKCVAAISA